MDINSCGILNFRIKNVGSEKASQIPFCAICFSRKNEHLAPSNDSEMIANIVKKYTKVIVIYFQRDTTNLQMRNDMMDVGTPSAPCSQFIYTRLKPTIKPVSVNYIIEFFDNDHLSETINIAKLLKKDKTHSLDFILPTSDTGQKSINIEWKYDNSVFSLEAQSFVNDFFFEQDSSIVQSAQKKVEYFKISLDNYNLPLLVLGKRGILHFKGVANQKKLPVTACCFSRLGDSLPPSLATDSVNDLIHRYAKTIVVYQEVED